MVVWGSGIAIREWLYAADFGRIVHDIVTGKVKHGLSEPINIAQNFGLSIRELVSIILENTKTNVEIVWDKSMPDGAPKKVMDDSKFRKTFSDFKFTDFNKGLEDTIDYYKSIYPF